MAEAGDMWDPTAVAADSKLVVSFVVGKRTHEHTQVLVHDAKNRLRPGHLPVILTEAYGSYASAIVDALGRRYPQAGRPSSVLVRWPHGLAYGQGKNIYAQGRVERVEGRVIRGKARLNHVLYVLGDTPIKTRVVARHNGTSRLRNRRTGRQPLAFSKAPRSHRWMSGLSVGLSNFCRAHASVKKTQDTQVQHRSPAMAAKLTDHLWTIREWVLGPV